MELAAATMGHHPVYQRMINRFLRAEVLCHMANKLIEVRRHCVREETSCRGYYSYLPEVEGQDGIAQLLFEAQDLSSNLTPSFFMAPYSRVFAMFNRLPCICDGPWSMAEAEFTILRFLQ